MTTTEPQPHNRPASIVGLIGYAGAGKTTVATILEQELGYRRVSFADPVREAALALDPIVLAEGDDYDVTTMRLSDVVGLEGWDAAKRDVPEVRRILQRLGTEVGRSIDPDLWVRAWLQRVRSLGSVQIVADDVRFPNEAAAIRDMGGLLVHVWRPELVGDRRHESEQHVGRIATDEVLVNNGVFDNFRAQVLDFAHQHLA